MDKELIKMAGNLRRMRTEQLHLKKELASKYFSFLHIILCIAVILEYSKPSWYLKGVGNLCFFLGLLKAKLGGIQKHTCPTVASGSFLNGTTYCFHATVSFMSSSTPHIMPYYRGGRTLAEDSPVQANA